MLHDQTMIYLAVSIYAISKNRSVTQSYDEEGRLHEYRAGPHMLLLAVCIIAALLLPLTFFFSVQTRNFEGSFSYIGQIAQDWERRPFVEIKVENDGCMPGWDPVFSKEWSGLM